MLNFTYRAPTQVIFGKDTEGTVGRQITAAGGSRVLVHYGGGSAKKSGLLDRVCASLEEAGLRYTLLGGVKPNPRLSLVREGIALYQKEKMDFILAVGGGSAIDSAKAIGVGVRYDGDVWDFYDNKAEPAACAPLGVVLTLAAAGSETSNSSVITNEEGWLKRGLGSELIRPLFAIMNPALTSTLPPYQTASGGVDIMMHTLERYLTRTRGVELGDGMCEALLRTVMHNIPIALQNPGDYDARAELMWAGSLSHNGLLGCGRQEDWATHRLEHELSGMFDVAHGAGLAALWGSWARYVLHADPARFAQLAVNVLGCVMDLHDPEKTALEGIAAMEAYFRSIHMPASIRELGHEVTDAQIAEMADKSAFSGPVGQFVPIDRDAALKIYTMAR